MVLVHSVQCVEVKRGQKLAGAGFVAAEITNRGGLIGDPCHYPVNDLARPYERSERSERPERERTARMGASQAMATPPTRRATEPTQSMRLSGPAPAAMRPRGVTPWLGGRQVGVARTRKMRLGQSAADRLLVESIPATPSGLRWWRLAEPRLGLAGESPRGRVPETRRS